MLRPFFFWSKYEIVQNVHPNTSPGSPEVAENGLDEIRVVAIQEELQVGVKTTETGAVRIHKVVHEQARSLGGGPAQ